MSVMTLEMSLDQIEMRMWYDTLITTQVFFQ